MSVLGGLLLIRTNLKDGVKILVKSIKIKLGLLSVLKMDVNNGDAL